MKNLPQATDWPVLMDTIVLGGCAKRGLRTSAPKRCGVTHPMVWERIMRLIGSSFAALLAMATSAHAAGWQTYEFRDSGFSIESLVPLTKGVGNYKGAIAGQVPTVTYTGEAENIRYKVSIVDISKRPADAVNLYLEMEFLTSLGGKVLANEGVGIEP